MAIASVSAFWEAVRKHQLLEPAQMAKIGEQPPAQFTDPKSLAKELLQRGWLTAFQANTILQGRIGDLVLGNYVLLERLGEGGMGQVFKARHRSMDRIVAVKVIHKDRLANPNAIRRFYNEVKAAARLSHPNIVLAFDADQVGGTHFLVMEYVDGLDLSKLVKQQGAVPVERACDYIRQAAMGLQHAHEHGMVHRDIKPHNLLVTRKGGMVKILDMGLARLTHEEDVGPESGLTKEGVVIGSIDYLAPEQAADSHAADIRADLYSLGCTFYYLLAGRVPFPGEVAMQKLLKHRLEEPTPLEQLRQDVPPGVSAIIRKLMAKEPAQRFQAPAAVAAALESSSRGTTSPEDTLVTKGKPNDELSVFADLGSNDTVESATVLRTLRRPASAGPPRQRHYLLLGGGAGVVALAVGLLVVLLNTGDKPVPTRAQNQPAVKATTPQDEAETWNQSVRDLAPEEQFQRVVERLKKTNVGFEGPVTPTYTLGLNGLNFQTDYVRDLSALTPLTRLDTLVAYGSGPKKGLLINLLPLQGLQLTRLELHNTAVADLTPLRKMPLTFVNLSQTRVVDLTPLEDSPLNDLRINNTAIVNLGPLMNLPLTRLECNDTLVLDCTGLKGTRLTFLSIASGPLAKLDGLEGVKTLTSLNFSNTKVTDLTPLKELVKLTALTFNSVPTVTDLGPLAELKALASLSISTTKVADLSPLKGLTSLTTLAINSTEVASLEHLVELKALTNINFAATKVADLTPLKGLVKLTTLTFNNTPVEDLGPLQGLPALASVNCSSTKVTDLSPLAGTKIGQLRMNGIKADLTPLKQAPLKKIWLDYQPDQHAEALRAIVGLETINDKPAAEVLK